MFSINFDIGDIIFEDGGDVDLLWQRVSSVCMIIVLARYIGKEAIGEMRSIR